MTLSGSPSFMPRWVVESGDGVQVFFMTDQPLVAQDSNRRDDVYEWESRGLGGCAVAGGCVAPLSSVTSPEPATLIDASEFGNDVFFTQRASLVPSAVDEDVKLYDARVDGGFPESSLACSGTGCQGVPPSSPRYATPASATFSGIGNFPPPVPVKVKVKSVTRTQKLAKALKVCRSKSKRRRGLCEKQARKQYGPAKKKGKR